MDIKYDPSVIREFAARLYRHADSLITLGGLLGAVVGAVLGAMMGSRFDSGGVGAIIGLAVCAIIGALIGRAAGFKYRLQAQVALCQVQIEENTRLTAGRVEQRPANVNAA